MARSAVVRFFLIDFTYANQTLTSISYAFYSFLYVVHIWIAQSKCTKVVSLLFWFMFRLSIHRTLSYNLQFGLLNPDTFIWKFTDNHYIPVLNLFPTKKALFSWNSNPCCTFPIKISAWFIYPFASKFSWNATCDFKRSTETSSSSSSRKCFRFFFAYGYDLFARIIFFTFNSVLSTHPLMSLVAVLFTASHAYR